MPAYGSCHATHLAPITHICAPSPLAGTYMLQLSVPSTARSTLLQTKPAVVKQGALRAQSFIGHTRKRAGLLGDPAAVHAGLGHHKEAVEAVR